MTTNRDEQHPQTDEERASDERVRAMMEAFMRASMKSGATIEDALRAAIGLLMSVARDAGASRRQLVDLIDLQFERYLDATDAELRHLGVERVPPPDDGAGDREVRGVRVHVRGAAGCSVRNTARPWEAAVLRCS